MKSSKIIAVIIALAGLAWIGSGMMSEDKVPEATQGAVQKQEPQTPKIPEVRVKDMTAENYTDDVILTGRTQASQRVDMKAETSGQVKVVDKEEGDSVSAGDILAELEIREREARKTEAQKRVSQKEIEYNAAKKLEKKGFNSKVRLAQAVAELEDARAELESTSVDLSKTKIAAPFDGIIAMQDVEVGDYLAIGDPVFTIVNLNPIEFVGFVSERRVQDLEVGQTAYAEFLDNQTVEAKVTYIAPAADAETRTFRIVISTDNSDLKIKDGLTAKIRIPVADRKAHKISPAILALNDAGQVGVKIVNAQNIVEFIPVKILADQPDAMWIAGPPATAKIITVGQDFVGAGQTVKPVQSDGEGLL